MSYTNPLAQAHVTPERIDMGVDYAGTGSLVAMGKAVVTQVNPGGWGSFGNYIEYKLLDGPAAGKFVYYAEGVTPTVHAGQIVNAGDPVATLIPGWHSGIEIGWGSGQTNRTYATAFGGGYSEGQRTGAGQSFSDFIHALGAPAGLAENRPVIGSGPGLPSSPANVARAQAVGPPGSVGSPLGTAGDAISGIANTAGSAISDAVSAAFGALWDAIASKAEYAALAFVAIIGGFLLMSRGLKRTTHPEPTPA